MEPFKNDSTVFSEYFIEMMEKIFDPIPVPIILVDHDTKVVMINQVFADFLGQNREDIIGKKVAHVDPTTRFPEVFKKRRSEIAWKHQFSNGRTAIVHRIPVLDEQKRVQYGFGMLLFEDVQEFRDIISKNKLLESELKKAKSQLKEIRGAKYSWDSIIGNSERMQQSLYLSKKSAETTSNVLLLGESGTGKELFAHAIHNGSERAHEKFVKINCAAIPAELLESELFGYVEGAFTGAKRGGKVGKFELAEKGTIFLDEIGEMPLSMQVKLLRVLQEKEVERVGGNKTVEVDVRVIAATNQNLESMIAEGTFREDLFYRLNVMAIEIPPLRERDGDLILLAEKLLEKVAEELGKIVPDIAPSTVAILEDYDWAGNVRELENVLERALNLAESTEILPIHLPYAITRHHVHKKVKQGSLKDIMEETEKEMVLSIMKETGGNKRKAAEKLDISRSSLYDKLEKYEITD